MLVLLLLPETVSSFANTVPTSFRAAPAFLSQLQHRSVRHSRLYLSSEGTKKTDATDNFEYNDRPNPNKYNSEEQISQFDAVLVQDFREQYEEWRDRGNAMDPKSQLASSASTTSTTSALRTASWTPEMEETFSVASASLSAAVAGSMTAEAAESAVATTTTVTTVTTETEDQEKQVNTARLLLLLAAALYGTNFSLVKMLGETDIPVGVSSALRFGMAALATSPWLLPGRKGTENGENAKMNFSLDAITESPELAATLAGFEVGMWNSIGYVAQAVGLETTAASKSAFICSLAVVVVPILDYMTGKTLLSRQVIGALMALGGVAALELSGMDSTDLKLSSGDLVSLIQPLAFGMGFWKMEKAMHKFPNEANRSTAAQLLAVFCGSAVYALATERSSLLDMHQLQLWLSDPMILASLVWTGCITTALTVYMETIALKTLSAAETTLIFSTEPLWGTAFAAAVMGEQLGPAAAAGAALILSGCVFSNLGLTGIQAFLFPNKETEESLLQLEQLDMELDLTKDETVSSLTATTMKAAAASKTPTLKAPFHVLKADQWKLLRAGVGASIVGSASGVWSDISIGTKVLAIQVQDVVENIFPTDIDIDL